MERMMFLRDHDRPIRCLLNPEDIELSPATETMLAVQGAIRINLKLLFDISLSDYHDAVENVQELTAPLWDVCRREERVRLIWGRAWNYPGMLESVSERLELFQSGGTARRSWVTLVFQAESEGGAKRPSSTAAAAAAIPRPYTGVISIGKR